MGLYVGLDVSLKETSICVVDERGAIISEGTVLSEPAGDSLLAGWTDSMGVDQCSVMLTMPDRPLLDELHTKNMITPVLPNAVFLMKDSNCVTNVRCERLF